MSAFPPLLAVVGLTASGKTDWALQLAQRLDGEIIGADSRQVYRGCVIGAAAPTDAQRAAVSHHCIGHVDPRDQYHLARYLADARTAIADVRARGRRPILCGGAGQYVWALLEGWHVPSVPPDPTYRADLRARADREGAAALHAHLAQIDPPAAARIDPRNVRRVIRALEVARATNAPSDARYRARDPVAAVIVAPDISLPDLDAAIGRRVDAMIAAGLVAEVERLLAAGVPSEAPGLQGIGYREIVEHLHGGVTLDDARERIAAATRKLARAQAKWFRRNDPRIAWLPSAEAVLAHLQASERSGSGGPVQNSSLLGDGAQLHRRAPPTIPP